MSRRKPRASRWTLVVSSKTQQDASDTLRDQVDRLQHELNERQSTPGGARSSSACDQAMKSRKGLLVVMSAGSGAGKSTLCRLLLRRRKNLGVLDFGDDPYAATR